MRPHPRIRKTVKWGGLAGAAVFAAAWGASLYASVWYSAPASGCQAAVSSGELVVHVRSPWTPPPRAGFELHWGGPWTPMWHVYSAGDQDHWILIVSLMLPAAVLGAAGAAAWALDRRAPRPIPAFPGSPTGKCTRCGYDRAGLPGGGWAVCPECGRQGA